MKFRRTFAALLMPVLLSGCFLMPGRFASSLDVRRDGTFAFAYKGEVVFQSPTDMMPGEGGFDSAEWSDTDAYCSEEPKPATPAKPVVVPPAGKADGSKADSSKAGSTKDEKAVEQPGAEIDDIMGAPRDCTKAEIATQKKEWEQNRKDAAERRAAEAKQFGSIFGYTPGDDEANRRLAMQLMKYDGYRSVTYKGKGVFDVDYQRTGRIDHDFIFPLLPKSDIVFPFVIVRRQADGVVRVTAPALVGGGMKAFANRMAGLDKLGAGKLSPPDASMPTPTKGSFTLTSDGEFMTNNTEDGPKRVANGRQLVWQIGPDSDQIPEAVLQIGPARP